MTTRTSQTPVQISGAVVHSCVFRFVAYFYSYCTRVRTRTCAYVQYHAAGFLLLFVSLSLDTRRSRGVSQKNICSVPLYSIRETCVAHAGPVRCAGRKPPWTTRTTGGPVQAPQWRHLLRTTQDYYCSILRLSSGAVRGLPCVVRLPRPHDVCQRACCATFQCLRLRMG